MDAKQFCIEYDIPYHVVDDEVCVYIRPVAKLIGLSNVHSTLSSMNYTTCKFPTNTRGGSQMCTYMTFGMLKMLLVKSRKPKAFEIAKKLGVDIISPPIETESITFIKEAFAGENMVEQYTVDRYRIDLCFLDYKLAVECDEDSHKLHQEADDERQRHIEDKHGVTFIRFRPQEENFKISQVINQIYKHILACRFV
jgi:very-short-patch-repair endonuclease